MIRYRDLATAFSRKAFIDVLNFEDYSHFEWLANEYLLGCNSCSDLLKKAYSAISRHYKCEYVYKNELIRLLLRKYGSKKSVYFSEFRVGKSIADITMFNGESKAYEIKTEYDSPSRLASQLDTYRLLFDKCYIVVPASKADEYSSIVDGSTGIITMADEEGKISLEEIREATRNEILDTSLMMSSLRINEYENMAESLDASLEIVPGYEKYSYCSEIFSREDAQTVRTLYLREIKKRKNNTALLRKYPVSIRQMMLSLNLSESNANKLIEKLKYVLSLS